MKDILSIEMREKSNKYWYIALISGIVFVAVGLFILIFGKATFNLIMFLFSLALLFSGILEIAVSLLNKKTMKQWKWTLASGIFSLIFGVLLLNNPFKTLVVLALFVGISLLLRSIGGIILALNLKKIQYQKWGYILVLSLLGIVFSFALILDPVFLWAAITTFAAITLIAGGVVSIILSIFFKKSNRLEMSEQ